jgi:hypothetical protein
VGLTQKHVSPLWDQSHGVIQDRSPDVTPLHGLSMTMEFRGPGYGQSNRVTPAQITYRLGEDKQPINPWVGGVLLCLTDHIQG